MSPSTLLLASRAIEQSRRLASAKYLSSIGVRVNVPLTRRRAEAAYHDLVLASMRETPPIRPCGEAWSLIGQFGGLHRAERAVQ